MIPIAINQNNISFSAKKDEPKKLKYNHDTLLKNNIGTRTRISLDKLTNACTLYTAKGLKGSKNANFYEFLTMGTIPYIVGSGMLMAVFNSANRFFPAFMEGKASALGRKMALGVLLYGAAKHASKSLINKPVYWFTGVDANLPYAKVNYELPDNIYDTDITSIEYHKVFESVEFPRWDLLYGDETKGQKRNFYFDHVAKKMAMGGDLKDSDQEMKPVIKEIIVKSNTAKNISSYLWAAVGVGMAFQDSWDKFFNVWSMKFHPNKAETNRLKRFTGNMADRGRLYLERIKAFASSFIESVAELYKGPVSSKGMTKHAGKTLIFSAALSSLFGVINSISSSQRPSKLDASDVIEKNRKYVVN